MTKFPKNGDILLVDLGMVAKVRPVWSCSPTQTPSELFPWSPHSPPKFVAEGAKCHSQAPWLAKPCVVNRSGLGFVERHRLQRRLGRFPPQKSEEAKKVLARMFGLERPPVPAPTSQSHFCLRLCPASLSVLFPPYDAGHLLHWGFMFFNTDLQSPSADLVDSP